MKNKIALIGMPGCGKTTVGRAISAQTGLAFYDTDAVFTERYGSIKKYFSEHGEAEFRKQEAEIMKEFTLKNGVVSLGGGSVLNTEAVAVMKDYGYRFVYLRVALETLIQRMKGDTVRPLLANGAEEALTKLYKKRTPIYEEICAVAIGADRRTADEAAREVLRRVNKERIW